MHGTESEQMNLKALHYQPHLYYLMSPVLSCVTCIYYHVSPVLSCDTCMLSCVTCVIK